MKDPNPQSNQNAAPEDVATLYSWANLHGAKYRDFSAARAQTREKARLRTEQSVEEEPRQGEPEAAVQDAEGERSAEDARAAELAQQEQQERARGEKVQLEQEPAQRLQAQPEPMQQAELAAEQAARQAELAAQLAAAQQAAEQEAAELAAMQAAQPARDQAACLAEQEAVQRAAEQSAQQDSQQRTWQQQPPAVRFPAMPAAGSATLFSPQPGLKMEYQGDVRPPAYRPLGSQFSGPLSGPFSGPPQSGPLQSSPVESERAREESPAPGDPWDTPEGHEPAGRPAWLSTDAPNMARPLAPQFGLPAAPFALPQFPLAPSPATSAGSPAPEDTLQGSRDRLTSRWFALRGVFDGNATAAEALPAAVVKRPPAMAVFSLAGGVGKTSLVATLGRALSARGERVLLVDTAAFGLLPFFFGATDQRPGLLRTFTPPGDSSDAPVQMVTIDPEGPGAEQLSQEGLSGEILKFARGANRVIIDLATASGATTRRIMRMAPLVLVPVIADMNSVVSVSSIDSFFERDNNSAGKPALPYYVLNQFDASLPLHLDVREVLREQLGERLLPFTLRRASAMSEALAEGMTVVDYAPGSTLAEDFNTLAGWVKSLSAPAIANYRGVRWRER
jgi:cellulose synthase operon protein YhjQ